MSVQVDQIYEQPFTTHRYTMKILDISNDYVKWIGKLGYEHTTHLPILEKFIQNDGWILKVIDPDEPYVDM